jgi:hypothetical protein
MIDVHYGFYLQCCKLSLPHAKPDRNVLFNWKEVTDRVGPRFTNAPVHEKFGSQTNFESKKVSVDERFLGLRTRKLATAASQLLVNFGSVHIPASFRFTNFSVHERPPGTD